MCVDLDYFYAQCEERENPELKEKPVVIGMYSGRTEESGAVATANYVARKYGVRSGMPLFQAKRILKDKEAIFIHSRLDFYDEVSEKIMKILKGYSDRIQQESVDEAYIDVTQKINGSFNKAWELARKIKEEVLRKEQLTCSIGIGPNKLIAKMASGIEKPDGLTVIKPQEIKDFLYPLPVGKLFGIGKKTETKMQELGIKTVKDLAKFDVKILEETFGKNLGKHFYDSANGIDEDPVEEKPAEQFSRIVTLKENTRDLDILISETEKLAEDINDWIKKQGLAFKSIGIMAVMENLETKSRNKTLDSYTDSLDIVKKVSKELWEKFLDEEKRMEIRRIGLRVSNFNKQKQQKSVFEYF